MVINAVTYRQKWKQILLVLAGLALAGINILLAMWTAESRESVHALQAEEAKLVVALSKLTPETRREGAHLVKFAPELKDLSLLITESQQLLADAGLAVRDVSYVPVNAGAGAGVDSFDIAMRFKGEYMPMKDALTKMLQQNEGLALQSLALSRESAATPSLQMEAKFTLFYRRP
jgi:hypothetical protein